MTMEQLIGLKPTSIYPPSGTRENLWSAPMNPNYYLTHYDLE
jgi:hypothetical protein